jgi:signal transduction histidine kinase
VVHQLLSQVISAQEDERRRVARELHDDTSSSLAALVLQLHGAALAAEPGPRRAQLEGVQALAVHTLEEVHRTIRALRPSVLDDLGLRSAIAWTGEQLGKQGVAVRCEFSGLGERLPPLVETVIFRVVQEALTNVAKHAHADSVLLQATQSEGRLAVEIEDDGRGFDAATLARPGSDGRGWGLLGMRERVQMLGGTLQLDSTPGKGTRLVLTLPIPPPGAPAPERPTRPEASHG